MPVVGTVRPIDKKKPRQTSFIISQTTALIIHCYEIRPFTKNRRPHGHDYVTERLLGKNSKWGGRPDDVDDKSRLVSSRDYLLG